MLKISLGSAALLSSCALFGTCIYTGVTGGAAGYRPPARIRGRLRVLSDKEYLVLAAVCRRVLDGAQPAVIDGLGPEKASAGGLAGEAAGSSGLAGLVGLAGPDTSLWIDGYLGQLPIGMRDDVRGLLHLVEHAPPLLCPGLSRRFTALAPAEQDRVLGALLQSERALLRQGGQALKALACLAYYQDPRSFSAIAYSGPLVSTQGGAGHP